VVPPVSIRVSRVPTYSRLRPKRPIDYKVSDTSRTWLSQSLAVLSRTFCSPRKFLTLCKMVVALAVPCGGFVEKPEILCMVDLYLTTPYKHSPTSLFTCKQMKVNKVWAVPGSLATTTGIVVYFLFLRVLRCFSSPAYRFLPYEFR
jgi:hypothetical protein